MAAPSTGVLGGAGYGNLGNGVWSKTLGSFVVTVTLASVGTGGLLTVTPNGDVLASDIALVNASLALLGIVPGAQGVSLTAAGGMTATHSRFSVRTPGGRFSAASLPPGTYAPSEARHSGGQLRCLP